MMIIPFQSWANGFLLMISGTRYGSAAVAALSNKPKV